MAYYLPINSASLAHYFACACIKPAKYFDNKPQDIQDILPNTLLLSTKLGNKNADCCLEIVLTDNEVKHLQLCGNDFRLFPIPLPISRVKKIYFKDKRQLEQTLSNINLSAAFIPSSLAEVKKFSTVQFNRDKITDEIIERDYSDKVKLFDRILGALALMKTAREPYMNYSESYASTLSFFNPRVKEELDRQKHQINEKFFWLFTRSGKFANAIQYLEKKLTREDVDAIAAECKQKVERYFTGLVNFEKLSGITYAFAILQFYGVSGEAASQKIDILISNNFQDLKEGTGEGIALYYGYNRGYSIFNNSYGVSDTERQVVKFLLDSQLDYYTIESVYQYVFYSNNSVHSYPYIDSWCPNKVQNPKRKTDYKFLDTVFVGKKKPSVFSKEYLRGFWEEIKRYDIFNMTLEALIESVRNRVAEDAKEEFEEAAQTKFAEIDANWSAKFIKGSAEIELLRNELESQYKINAELQQQNEALVEEIELLKSTISSQQLIEEVEKHPQEILEPEEETLVDASEIDDLPEGDFPVSDDIVVDESIAEGEGDKEIEDLPEETSDAVVVEIIPTEQDDPIKSSEVDKDGMLPLFETNG